MAATPVRNLHVRPLLESSRAIEPTVALVAAGSVTP